jgi:hypothetical protein
MSCVRGDKTYAATSRATDAAKHAAMARTLSLTVARDAATISGDGVTPARIAAAIGSTPGSACATAMADAGRRCGSSFRHARTRRSMAGGSSMTTSEGAVTGPRAVPLKTRTPVKIS